MKTKLFIIVILIGLVACEEDGQHPVIYPKEITRIEISEKLFIDQTRDSLLTLFDEVTECNKTSSQLNYFTPQKQYITVYFHNDSVIAALIYSDFVLRDKLHNQEFLNQVDSMFFYGIDRNIIWENPVEINDLLYPNTEPVFRVSEYTYFECCGDKYSLMGMAYNSSYRACIIQAVKEGWGLHVANDKSTNLKYLVK